MIENVPGALFIVAGGALNAGLIQLLDGSRYQPRHARPRGWTGPTMPAPSPPVAGLLPYQRAMLAGLLNEEIALSPLNRASVRRRFSAMWRDS